jgi:DnaK suppressor protein
MPLPKSGRCEILSYGEYSTDFGGCEDAGIPHIGIMWAIHSTNYSNFTRFSTKIPGLCFFIRKATQQKEFMKIENTGKTSYNEEELNEFRKLINYKLDEAQKEYDFLVDQLRNYNHNGTDDTQTTIKIMEDGYDTNIREELSINAIRIKKFIENLRAALIRIENKTYGICRATGKLIPKERLLAVPHTTQTIEAKNASK